MFNEGISVTGDLIDLAVNENIVEKSGAWFSFNNIRIGQGRENSKQFLKDNPDLQEEIRKAVMEKKGVGAKLAVPADQITKDAEEDKEPEDE
jgi:recombination protein RecA